MSMSLMVLAMKARVGNPLRKLVLIKLADNASDSGECWPAVSTIAEHCEISERSVQNHIKQLVKDGFVRVEERRGENGVSRTNIYHLLLKWEGANPAPYKKPSKKEGANAAPYGANLAGGGCKSCRGEGANAAPRTSQLEPVIESNTPPTPSGRGRVKPKFDPLTVDLPGWLQPSLWQEWVEYRRALQKPIKTLQGVNGLIRKLDDYRRQGLTPAEVIQHSMACEYQGLFAPSATKNSAQHQSSRGTNYAGMDQGATANAAVQRIRAARDRSLRSRGPGVEILGDNGGNIFEPLGTQKRLGTIPSLDFPDCPADQPADNGDM